MRASPTVGSASPPVHRAASSATLIASASPSLSMNRPPPLRWIQEISESCRNRLAWRSSALRTPSTAASARPRFSGGHTATRALVPSAARSATATVVIAGADRRHAVPRREPGHHVPPISCRGRRPTCRTLVTTVLPFTTWTVLSPSRRTRWSSQRCGTPAARCPVSLPPSCRHRSCWTPRWPRGRDREAWWARATAAAPVPTLSAAAVHFDIRRTRRIPSLRARAGRSADWPAGSRERAPGLGRS